MIAVIEYGAGNIGSIANALRRLGVEPVVTGDPELIGQASRVILPGVGAAGPAMRALREKGLDNLIPQIRQPLLGICLGLQLLCTYSEEQSTPAMRIFEAGVKRFPKTGIVPHMGWNEVRGLHSPLFRGVKEGTDLYFVHGYYAEPSPEDIADCTYLIPFAAAKRKDNFYATQFHPEKSGEAGRRILQNFLEL